MWAEQQQQQQQQRVVPGACGPDLLEVLATYAFPSLSLSLSIFRKPLRALGASASGWDAGMAGWCVSALKMDRGGGGMPLGNSPIYRSGRPSVLAAGAWV